MNAKRRLLNASQRYKADGTRLGALFLYNPSWRNCSDGMGKTDGGRLGGG